MRVAAPAVLLPAEAEDLALLLGTAAEKAALARPAAVSTRKARP